MAELASRGAEAIILGCTEMSLLVDHQDSPVPLFDTTALHARQAAEWALAADSASMWRHSLPQLRRADPGEPWKAPEEESMPAVRSPINLAAKLALVQEHWSPRVVAELNDYQFKVVKLQGDFVWHVHEATDEAFLVLSGEMEIGGSRRVREASAGRAVRGAKGRGAHHPRRGQVPRPDHRASRRGEHGRSRRLPDGPE